MISLVIGLGNIGEKYAGTRHNLGFEVLDLVFEKLGLEDRKSGPFYYRAEKKIDDRIVRFVWPTTYMNNCGIAVSHALAEFGVSPEDMLVVVDDYNLPLGKLRIRLKGSDGGHNGLESIINHLKSRDFPRLRLGIGPIPENIGSIDFVLGRFSCEEAGNKKKMLEKAGDVVLYSFNHRLEEAMTIYNSDPAPDEENDEQSGAV
ncbi:MAG: aminoacyl-tRNA hydrolase [Candidatus Zixiibacteriota bacterium]|nr:MAG: aminoacyl-tRNA hydrolase [candidate division Zixibacteria bacterium]HDL04163.1 aminoacyl-tRNA hydrolase [candidate division Zixibacteria bacterium]